MTSSWHHLQNVVHSPAKQLGISMEDCDSINLVAHIRRNISVFMILRSGPMLGQSITPIAAHAVKVVPGQTRCAWRSPIVFRPIHMDLYSGGRHGERTFRLHFVEHLDCPWYWYSPVCNRGRHILHCHWYAPRRKHRHDAALLSVFTSKLDKVFTDDTPSLSRGRTTHNCISTAYFNAILVSCGKHWYFICMWHLDFSFFLNSLFQCNFSLFHLYVTPGFQFFSQQPISMQF